MSLAEPVVEAPPMLAERVERRIAGYGSGRAVVAFSGGVDSATVVALAARALGPEAVAAVTAVSPSYPAGELELAAELARSLGVVHRVVTTGEVEREAYARNDVDRCFHCKTELYGTLRRVFERARDGRSVLMSGANADDVDDLRPGLRAAGRHDVRNPLLEEGLGKDAVRSVARHLGLAVADKPALACLSSRVAFGVRVTADLLARIDHAEQRVRSLGFDVVRVRHFGDTASIEVSATEVERLLAHPAWAGVRAELEGMGWRRVVVDLRGYRMGSLNAILPSPP
jgi:pyridinium-3,5-biscarboxylic acid mononucleotide sulfurtransferase